MMQECFRWYGPDDPVSLSFIRQCGCQAVFTALHHIAYGQVWPLEEIQTRKQQLTQHGLAWSVAESVPVSEEIKTRSGHFEKHLENYCNTIINLGREGVGTVIYNFMPVLDWVRTDLAYKLDDGSECLYYDPAHFAAFEIFVLQRDQARNDYSNEQLARAEEYFQSLSPVELETFKRTIVDMFPGRSFGYEITELKSLLSQYDAIGQTELRSNLQQFLEVVVPVAEKSGVRLAIHPDDPPFSILGLPRIVSTEQDLQRILAMDTSTANGICFCTGSLSARADNELPAMVERFSKRIHAVHLRSVTRHDDGSFLESNHLEGCVDMPRIVARLLVEQRERREAGDPRWQLAFRPDHGHRMLDDLGKPPVPNPGYSCLGRMRALAELRGLQHALDYEHRRLASKSRS